MSAVEATEDANVGNSRLILRNRTTRGPIGIDVGSRHVKAVQLAGPTTRPTLAASASVERPEPAAAWGPAEAERLQQVLDRRGFEGRQVVTVVPTDHCLSGVLSLPPAESGAPRGEMAAAEMARMHRCDPAEIQVALWNLPTPARGGEGAATMAAGCRHDHAETLLTSLEHAGLDVCALDIEGWALVRAAGPRLRQRTGATAILDLGWSAANLALVHGTTLIYKRVLGGTGLDALAETLCREHRFEQSVIDHLLTAVGMEHDSAAAGEDPQLVGKVRGPLESYIERIAQELSLSLSYAAHQYPDAPVEQLLLAGGGGRIAGLEAALSRRLEVEVQTVTPATSCEVPASLASDAAGPELAIALGLALYRDEEAAT